ncbi:MAG TPA: twin-arginine translocase TatA/TatE family subunit [Acidimicrobiales bacterium]|nr:twin-arginine translocase TatA/TatE family subunit [Acidimicrobiales bacterium]
MFGNLDPVRILMILLAAVVLLGPERLPKAARQLGSFWRDISTLRERLENEVRSAMPDLDLPKIPAIPTIKKGAVSGYINDLMTPGTAVPAAVAAEAEASPSMAMAASPAPVLALGRPGSQPASDNGSDGARLADWKPSYGLDRHVEQADVPAGWHAGAEFPGYAMGARLANVPSSAARGPIHVEALLSFDEPGWN